MSDGTGPELLAALRGGRGRAGGTARGHGGGGAPRPPAGTLRPPGGRRGHRRRRDRPGGRGAAAHGGSSGARHGRRQRPRPGRRRVPEAGLAVLATPERRHTARADPRSAARRSRQGRPRRGERPGVPPGPGVRRVGELHALLRRPVLRTRGRPRRRRHGNTVAGRGHAGPHARTGSRIGSEPRRAALRPGVSRRRGTRRGRTAGRPAPGDVGEDAAYGPSRRGRAHRGLLRRGPGIDRTPRGQGKPGTPGGLRGAGRCHPRGARTTTGRGGGEVPPVVHDTTVPSAPVARARSPGAGGDPAGPAVLPLTLSWLLGSRRLAAAPCSHCGTVAPLVATRHRLGCRDCLSAR